MVIAEDNAIICEASSLGSVTSKYQRILQNIPIFSNLHKMGGEEKPLTQTCNQMILLPCNQPVRMVVVEDNFINYEDSTLRTVSIEFKRIPSRNIQTGMIIGYHDTNM
jgi:hypothetical protein